MKFLFLLFSVMFAGFAQADLAEKFQQKCSTPAIKNIIGQAGSCRIIIAPTKKDIQGMCYATLKEMPCKLTYNSSSDGAPVVLTCGMIPGEEDEPAPVRIETRAEAAKFSVATFIKKPNGKEIVQIEANDYIQLSSEVLTMDINGSDVSINVNFQGETQVLTNVVCM